MQTLTAKVLNHVWAVFGLGVALTVVFAAQAYFVPQLTGRACADVGQACLDGQACFTCIYPLSKPSGWFGCNTGGILCNTSYAHCDHNPSDGAAQMYCENKCP